MNPNEISEDKSLTKYISDFVNSPLFLVVKDAFTNHTPEGKKEAVASSTEHPLLVAHGQLLGTRYVFNQMEQIRDIGRKQPQKQHKPSTGKDPDLAD